MSDIFQAGVDEFDLGLDEARGPPGGVDAAGIDGEFGAMDAIALPAYITFDGIAPAQLRLQHLRLECVGTRDHNDIAGGRNAGSITAAQFLQRFVNNVPWAHLDIAGTALDSPRNAINPSWGSGWGVRLLNRLVADHYE